MVWSTIKIISISSGTLLLAIILYAVMRSRSNESDRSDTNPPKKKLRMFGAFLVLLGGIVLIITLYGLVTGIKIDGDITGFALTLLMGFIPLIGGILLIRKESKKSNQVIEVKHPEENL